MEIVTNELIPLLKKMCESEPPEDATDFERTFFGYVKASSITLLNDIESVIENEDLLPYLCQIGMEANKARKNLVDEGIWDE